jgi:hypothetical protein
MKGYASTFIQDIGRCCGHEKPKAVVLMSLTDKNDCASGETGQLMTNDINFRQLHGLLTKQHAPNAEHTEKHEKVFSELLPCSTILDAEPQIGKTGAVLSVLEIFYTEHTSLSKVSAVTPKVTLPQRTKEHHDELREITAKLCAIINNPAETLDENIEKLRATLSVNNLFQHYHALIGKFQDAKELSESIYKNSLIAPMNSATKAKQNTFSIIDCGCGLHGIMHIVRENSLALDLPVHVIGIDLQKSILQLKHIEPAVANVIFTAHVADMASNDEIINKNAPFNVVLYCLSLFENDITRHISWANKQLKIGGMLIIADLDRRFPNSFEKSVKKYGFKNYSSYQIANRFRVSSFKKVSDNIDESQTVQLKLF